MVGVVQLYKLQRHAIRFSKHRQGSARVDITDEVNETMQRVRKKSKSSLLLDAAGLPPDSGFTSLTVTLPTLPTSTVGLASIHLLDRSVCLTNLTRLPPVSVLEKLHAKHVLPGFNDRSREEREIEASTADITRVFPLSHAEIRIIQAHHHFLWNTRISVAYIP
jgi:hypothetical protein